MKKINSQPIVSADQKARMRDDASRLSGSAYARDVPRLLDEIEALQAKINRLEKDKITLLNRANQTTELKEILGTKDIRNRSRITDNLPENN